MANRNNRTPDHEIARLRAEVELLAAQMAAMRISVGDLDATVKDLTGSITGIDDVTKLLERHVNQLATKIAKL